MSSDPSKTKLIAKNLRRVAQVWSILVWLLAVILVIGTLYRPSTSNLVNDPVDILIPICLMISLVGLGIAFRREGWGVLINISFYLAILPLYWLLHGERLQASIMVGLSPVILPGVLFGAAWILSKRGEI